MKYGDTVKVYPHGRPEMERLAEVMILSDNQLSIAVKFMDRPCVPLTEAAALLDPYTGSVVMLASRDSMEGKPWRPWQDVVTGSLYEIKGVE